MQPTRSARIHLSFAAGTDVGRVRHKNEDAFLVVDLSRKRWHHATSGRIEVGSNGILLVVSDGMGGERAGEVASALVVEGLARALETSPAKAQPVTQLRQAAERANSDVVAAATGAREGMGATLTAVYMAGATAYIAEVGDSRAYVLRSGRIRQLTRDQNFAQILLDVGALKPEEAMTSPMRSVLAQAMGQDGPVQVALCKLALRDRDRLLLCSDGLSSAATDEEIRDTILRSKTLDMASKNLVSLANSRGGDDNVTVVLADVGGDLPRAEPHERVSQTYEILESFSPSQSRAERASSARPRSGWGSYERR